MASISDLLARVGGAMGGFESVHLSVGGESLAVIEADHQYLAGGTDFVVVLTTDPAEPVEARRVDGTFYARPAPDQPFVAVDPSVPDGDVPGAVTELADWDLLADLRAVLESGTGFAFDGRSDLDGTPVESYTFTVDAAALVDGATVADDLTGTVQVTFSIDDTGLPVRVDERFDETGLLVRTDYGAWGEPVDVEVPAAG